jgi:hypothetical protein
MPGVVVSAQRMDQVTATQGPAQAANDQSVADLDLAKLNLERSEVRAAVNGVVTDMELRPGTYLTPRRAWPMQRIGCLRMRRRRALCSNFRTEARKADVELEGTRTPSTGPTAPGVDRSYLLFGHRVRPVAGSGSQP